MEEPLGGDLGDGKESVQESPALCPKVCVMKGARPPEDVQCAGRKR